MGPLTGAPEQGLAQAPNKMSEGFIKGAQRLTLCGLTNSLLQGLFLSPQKTTGDSV